MIYFVDEDVNQLKAFSTEMRIRGYKSTHLFDADEAFTVLSVAQDIDIVVLDIMLSANDNKEGSKYTRENSFDFLQTGLCLLEDLVSRNERFFPKKVVIFTNASEKRLFKTIKDVADRYGIPLLRKSDYTSPYKFGNKIEEILKGK